MWSAPPPPPPPPPPPDVAAQVASYAFSLLLGYVLFAVLRRQFFNKLTDHVSAVLAAEDEQFAAEEDAQARYRFTPARHQKVLPAGGEWDAIFIGSGPGSLACAATMSKLGWRCAVFEQGEQLGGGAHVFPDKGFEFETGVHYLGDETEMKGLLDFLTCGRLKLATMGTPVEEPVGVDGKPLAASTKVVGGDHARGMMYDNIVLNGVSYNFLAGRHKMIAMLRARFPSAEHARQIDAFDRLFSHHTSQSYKTSAAKFFVLKVPYLLNYPILRPLRTLLQTWLMGRHYYNSTQLTAEQMLTKCGIDIGSELGAVMLGQYGDSGMRPDKLSQMMHMGVMSHYSEGGAARSQTPRTGTIAPRLSPRLSCPVYLRLLRDPCPRLDSCASCSRLPCWWLGSNPAQAQRCRDRWKRQVLYASVGDQASHGCRRPHVYRRERQRL